MKKLFIILLIFCSALMGCSEGFGENAEYNYEITIWYLQQENPETIHYTAFSSIDIEPKFYTWRKGGLNCLNVKTNQQVLRIACYVRRFETKLLSKRIY